MSILDSLLVAIFVMILVFAVLVILDGILRIQAAVFSFIEKKKVASLAVEKELKEATLANAKIEESNKSTKIEGSAGNLKLIGVDERTTAMIMAIVSDELNIPLSELQFKSVRALSS